MKIKLDDVLAAIQEDDNLGFCLNCGEQQGGVEPDAEHYRCEACGHMDVFGAEQILLLGQVEGGGN
jgi:hypothetical protein